MFVDVSVAVNMLFEAHLEARRVVPVVVAARTPAGPRARARPPRWEFRRGGWFIKQETR